MLARYVLRRLLITVPVVIGVTVITFLLMHAAAASVVPGLGLDPSLRPEDVVRLRRYLGLDRPLWVQYLAWAGGLLHGDFGRSMLDGSPVTAQILDRLPATLELNATALALAIAISIPVGSAGARLRGRLPDHLLSGLAVVGVAIPQFWLGVMAVLVFSVAFSLWGLPFLPQTGAYTAGTGGLDPLDRLSHLALPATVLAFAYIAIWSRFTRSSLIEALSQDYVLTARAKGMPERRVLYVHALRNALGPMITLVGLELPSLFSGGLVVESVFGWPGIGRLALESAQHFDYTMVFGITTFVAVLVVSGNLLADVLQALVDPRVKYT